MKTMELRIGNYVYFNGEICTVAGYSHTFIHLNNCKKGSILEHIKPIPISDGLLLKFGFKEDKFCLNGFYKKNIVRNISLKSHMDTVYLDIDDEYDLADCKYVHQLQNLFFALTGEELTFIE